MRSANTFFVRRIDPESFNYFFSTVEDELNWLRKSARFHACPPGRFRDGIDCRDSSFWIAYDLVKTKVSGFGKRMFHSTTSFVVSVHRISVNSKVMLYRAIFQYSCTEIPKPGFWNKKVQIKDNIFSAMKKEFLKRRSNCMFSILI